MTSDGLRATPIGDEREPTPPRSLESEHDRLHQSTMSTMSSARRLRGAEKVRSARAAPALKHTAPISAAETGAALGADQKPSASLPETVTGQVVTDR